MKNNKMIKNDTVIGQCLERWKISGDSAEELHNKYNKWYGQLSGNMADMVSELMKYFDYYSHEEVNRCLRDLHTELHKIDSIDDDNMIYTVLTNQNGRYSSSYDYIGEYKQLNKINKYIVYPDFDKFIKETEYIKDIDNIVLVDDCCGSGKTFIDFVKKYADDLMEKNIYYIVVHAMKEAVDSIGKFAKQNNLNINVICGACTDKAFNRGKDIYNRKDEFIDGSIRLGISKNYALGYNKTESLMAFYNNTPNNTLGIFWMDGKEYKSLFPRNNDKKPTWLTMDKAKERQKRSNYFRKVNRKR